MDNKTNRQTERRRSERKHLQSSLSQRHRTKDGKTIKNRTVTINETGARDYSEDNDIRGGQKDESSLSQSSEQHKDWM